MSMKPLDRLCDAYGLQRHYYGVAGKKHVASNAAKRAILKAMSVAVDDDAAIARCLIEAPPPMDATIAAPAGRHCFLPEWLESGRSWGVTCQLYGLRSARNCGIGDFEDLANLAERVAADGGDFVGVNPVHALFAADPERCSPFSPSNRRYLNPLYIALDRIPGVNGPVPVDEDLRARARSGEQVDYQMVARLKLGVLRTLWHRLDEEKALWTMLSRTDFARFVTKEGLPLWRHALFEALSDHFVARGMDAGWHAWPEDSRDADSRAVRQFAAENENEVQFHLWLQWVADTQLGAAAERARTAGMRIGLYLDIATGTAPDGSATWSDPDLVVSGATIGAPPDAFFSRGQNWGLAPLSPAALRARAVEPYRDMLEAVARHAGAIRLDHAMSVHRLFWIPDTMSPAEGCYVLYPMVDMLRVLAEVSVSRKAIIIGEDLGTVPKGFSETLQGAHILSSRILFFEWARGGFRAAASYRRCALVSVSSHDLPPFAAWWQGNDIALFQSLGLSDDESIVLHKEQRTQDRRALISRLQRGLPKKLLPESLVSTDDCNAAVSTGDAAVAVHAFLARTPSLLFGLQFEDLCGADAPVNVPGTFREYPNWRLRAPASIEEATGSELWARVVTEMARARPK